MEKTVQTFRRGEGHRIRVLAGYMEWKLTPAETGGHYCVLETFVPPGARVPPHQHADHEAFYVLEGSVEVARLGPSGLGWLPVGVGDFVNVPSNEVHGFRNTGDAPARLLVTATAGLGAFFEEAGVPVSPDALPMGHPSAAEVERVLAIAHKHGHRFLQQSAGGGNGSR